jgi:hypothetical protein
MTLRSPWSLVVSAFGLGFAVSALGMLASSIDPVDPFGIVLGLAILLPSLFFLARALGARVRVEGDRLTSHGYAKTVTVHRGDIVSVRSSDAGAPDLMDLVATGWSPDVILASRDSVELNQLAGFGWGKRRNQRVEAQTARLKSWLADRPETTE